MLTAAAHLGDAYGVDHVAGTWLGLAHAAGRGTLYPPLYDGYAFAGTRYMPIPIVLHGGLGRAIGDDLVAGKLIAFVLTALLLVVVVQVVRREGCRLPVAVLLAATLLVTDAGLTAATAIRHDTLPLVLQLAAVAIVSRSTRPGAVAGAAALCALALGAKSSAVWAPASIALWLLARQRSRLAVFAGTFVAVAALVLGLFEAVSRGRMTENVVGLGRAGSRGFESLDWELDRLRLILGEGLGPVRLLVVVALVLAALSLRRRTATLFEMALLVSLPILAVVLADRGTSTNQLLDLHVLSLVVIGAAWGRLGPPARLATAGAVLAVAVGGAIQNVEPVDAARGLVERDGSRLPEVARHLGTDDRILSENPYVPVSLGQRPVVMDAFMLWKIARDHPDWRADLVRRLDEREFDAVVLFYRPEDRARSALVRFWFDTEHFGPEIVDAIARNYRAGEQVGDSWIYRPRS